jgi:protein O-GlcNAc transferase
MTQSPDEIFHQGLAHRTRGQLPQAIASFREVLKQNPNHQDATLWLGVSLTPADPAEAAKWLQQFISQKQNNASAYFYLGRALRLIHSYRAAIQALENCLRLEPAHIDARHEIALVQLAGARHEEALATLRRLLEERPDLPVARSTLLHILNLTSDDPAEILREHRLFQEIVIKPRVKPEEKFWAGRNPLRRIKVGYLSPHFNDHPQSRFTVPLFSNHNREVFQIHCYSDAAAQDEITRRLVSHADIWRNFHGKSDDQLFRQIWEDGIDILIDLSVHTEGGRPLFLAQKPAPIQVAWLPYPATTGLAAIDYRLTDVNIDPLGTRDNLYSECSVRLPFTFWAFDALDTETTVQPLPASKNGHITFGCLNDFSKITQTTIDLWRIVLTAIPTSRMIIRAPDKDAETRLAQQLNIGTRLQFVPIQPRPDCLKAFDRIDIALDTFPCNGHETSFDSFWMDVPVLTLAGNPGVSRAGASLAANLGLADQLVATTPDQFVQKAAKLAGDLPALAQLRASLRDKMKSSPLMDGDKFARHVESAYLQMWQLRCRNA